MAVIVLASSSKARVAMLSAAGIDFTAQPAAIDERGIEAPLLARGASPAEISAALAEAKALAIAPEQGDAFVIGVDQTLDLDGALLTKPESMADASRHLRRLSGRAHALETAIAVARNNRILWRHHETARLTVRPLTDDFIEDYLARVGEVALTSVGAYQIEGPGIQLFERIDGDHFTILGLPLLPLLTWLRQVGALR